ncbi:MAG: ferrochelatase [Chitinophagaceae bacterium]
MNISRIGILLVNLGTPDKPTVASVKTYLKQFLLDARVIDIPALGRNLLVRGIIAPFRSPKSARAYQKLWTKNGSPLKYFGFQNKVALQEVLGDNFIVEIAMRYQHPSIAECLEKLRKEYVKEIIILPLFPQYASATVGSVFESVMNEIKKWQTIPSLKFINHFYQHPLYIEAFAQQGRKYLRKKEYDHILFSYHGLPERQILKGDISGNTCLQKNCCDTIHQQNQYCYKAQCYATSRLLAKTLEIPQEKYTVSFQSRLGKTVWIQPYTEDIVKQLAHQRKKKILVFSPAFVADCLETTIEIAEEYKEIFLHLGGTDWDLVTSLNNTDTWIACLKALITENVKCIVK